MEKKILQTTQCPFCLSKIDIRATKCNNCASDLTTKEAQDKIRAMYEDQKLKKQKKAEEELKKKIESSSKNKKIFLYGILSLIVIILITRLKILGLVISLSIIIPFIIYKDIIFKFIDKNYIIKEKTKTIQIIKKIAIILLAIVLILSLVFLIYQQTPQYKQEQQAKIDEINRKAKEEEAKRIEENRIATEAAKKAEEEKAIQDEKNAPEELKKLIQDAKDTIKTNKTYSTIDEISTDLAIVNGFFGQKIKDYKTQYPNNKEIQTLVAQLETTVKNKQIDLFPNLRKNYGKIVGNSLWENNIDVTTYGTGNSTIEFTGYIFASNKNISDSYKEMVDMLKLLRFDRANFKFTDYGEYTYYTIESLKDGELLIK